jgi:two-component system chemotaxis response regulator CheY
MYPGTLPELAFLVVDDEPLVRKLVHGVLTSLGFTSIAFANSGRAAIEELGLKKDYDFLITDWRMKDLDGIDVVRFVRTSPQSPNKTLPIIMLTGNTEVHYVKVAIMAGVNSYLLKPFSAEQLVKRLRGVIEAPRDFIISKKYTGPDRRRVEMPPPEGVDRRKQQKKKPKKGKA